MTTEETPKKKYRVSVSYTIQVEAETDSDALFAARYENIYSNTTVRNLAMKVLGAMSPKQEVPAEPINPEAAAKVAGQD